MPAKVRRTCVMQRSRLHEMHRLLGQPDLISHANGASAADLYSVGRIASALHAALTHHSHGALNYALTEGFEPLREWIALKVRDARIAYRPIANICALERTSSRGLHWSAVIVLRFSGTLALCHVGSAGQRLHQEGTRWA